MLDQQFTTKNPLQEIASKTNQAFTDLQEGQIFTEKFIYYAIVAVVKKNLIVIYQGTITDLHPICYHGKEEVIKKFSQSNQSGYWVNYLETNKEFSDKLLND